jgi:glucose/arabinose dehydrogenase
MKPSCWRISLEGQRGASTANSLLVAAILVLGLGLGLYLWLQRGWQEASQANPALQQDATREETWRQVDPALVKYQQAGTIATGLLEPRGIALTPQQDVVIVGDRALRVLDWAGKSKREVPLPGPAHCVAVAPDGTTYVGLKDHVELYDAQGQKTATWAVPSPKSYLTCIALHGQDIYVGDAGQRVVLRYDMSGNVVGFIGQKDAARKIPGIIMPSPHLDVVVGKDGLLRVTNPGRRVVEVYDATGNLKSSWGKSAQDITGFSGCCNPTDLALLPDGRLVTAEKGLPRVKVHSLAGVLEAVVAPPEAVSAMASGMDLAVDTLGRVLVLDPPAKVVRVFAGKG